ncbi:MULTISPECIES: carboxypeptidase-like regulatory domain-containing protein [Deinococcus]|uniref:Carboxypeptidase-like regulatory domain-containing protein n=1 Tax=Deinococcus rufus TaxID=2136097 RepID=A0ABV7Z5J0_9DEIO|nr:carboxypeptidase-like regulatory domain-containing protein [Deinococcus sp. AB2017081]WQE95841.1 carboxypeptidase-like regulatory domain-containing protein [Deinococcus sp. AB2017081]
MFDGVSQRLTTWATTQGAGAVVFAGDAPHDSTLAARLSLLGILPFPPPRTLTRAPLRFRLRYLVTCPSTTPEAQTLLGRLLVSALQEPELQVELGDIAPEWWSALGWPPQPAFWLLVPVSVPLAEPTAPLAREHVLSVQTSGRAWRRGTVTDARGQPVAGARVQLGGAPEPLYTDASGHFELAARPEDTLHVAAVVDGQVREVRVQPPGRDAGWPVQVPPPE